MGKASGSAKEKIQKLVWSEEDTLFLCEQYRDGVDIKVISEALGRTFRAAHQRIYKLREAGVKIERRRMRGVDVESLNEKLSETAKKTKRE